MITWWMWMVAGFIMLATETLIPGFFLLFFGIGAVFMGFFQLLFPGIPLWIELLIFLTVSTAWLAMFRGRLVAYIEKRNPPKKVDSIEGETAIVSEDIAPGQVGKAELRGASWNALNLGTVPVSKGQRCQVEKMDGLTLHIKAM
ncbi:MAG: NfeD family protein [Acidobacteria bacterium]|nr:NfeD family protein [Acidobacteriota bacterium]